MPQFGVSNSTGSGGGGVQAAITTTYKSLIVTNASTATTAVAGLSLARGKWYDILIGTNTTPADNVLTFDVVRATYATSTAITTGDSATSLFVSSLSSNFLTDFTAGASPFASIRINSSVETFLTSPVEIWSVGINQRASYRWVAAPGSEMVYPAASSGAGPNALAIRCLSPAYTGTATATVLVNEG